MKRPFPQYENRKVWIEHVYYEINDAQRHLETLNLNSKSYTRCNILLIKFNVFFVQDIL